MTGGSRPFLGWADELEEFRAAFTDPMEHRRPSPEVERMLEERILKSSPSFRHVADEVRRLLEAGTVHHVGDSSRLFTDLDEKQRESDAAHAMRTAVESLVARYAADHPDVVR